MTNPKYQGIPDPPYFMGLNISGYLSITESQVQNDNTGALMTLLNGDTSTVKLNSDKLSTIPASLLPFLLAGLPTDNINYFAVQTAGVSGQTSTISITVNGGFYSFYAGIIIAASTTGSSITTSSFTATTGGSFSIASLASTGVSKGVFFAFSVNTTGTGNTAEITLNAGTESYPMMLIIGGGY